MFKKLLFIVLLWCSVCLPTWAQQTLLPVPPLTARVVDTTGTLTAAQKQALEAQLTTLEQTQGSQVVALLVPTTAPEDIFSYANRVGNAWKIGRKEVGDGVLIVVAVKDRKVRIEVAKTLEGAIPDLAAHQIIQSAFIPKFKNNDYAGGLQAGVDQISALIRGEKLPEPKNREGSKPQKNFQWVDLAIFLFLALPIATLFLRRILGKGLSSLVIGGGIGLLGFVLTASVVVAIIAAVIALLYGFLASSRSAGWGGWGGGSGWSGSGGGGGGFFSGGGGNFGGGGASGDW